MPHVARATSFNGILLLAPLFFAHTVFATDLTNLVVGADGPVNVIYRSHTNLYVGGRFTRIGEVAANNVAMFDGSTWRPLGDPAANGVNGEVMALTTVGFGEGLSLAVGGSFTNASGLAVRNLALWTAGGWRDAHGGVNGRVLALETVAGALFVGGEFTEAGDVTHRRLAQYFSDRGWQPASGGVNGAVEAMVPRGADLIVGGRFTEAGGRPANHIAIYEFGGTWKRLNNQTSAGVNGAVLALAIQNPTPTSDEKLYVGGLFDRANAVALDTVEEDTNRPPVLANNIAFFNFNTDEWSALSETSDPARVGALVPGGGVSSRSPGGVAPFVRAILIESNSVYVGGNFRTADGRPANNIARWDGRSWYSSAAVFGGGIEGAVHALEGGSAQLWVGGDFDQADYLPASNLALWREGARADWSSPGLDNLSTNAPSANPFQPGYGFSSSIKALAGSHNYVYAAGPWVFDHGFTNHGIWAWNTRVWRRIGQPQYKGNPGAVFALTLSQDDLCAGGVFDQIDRQEAANVAVRIGGNWERLGPGLSPRFGTAFTQGGFVSALSAEGSLVYAAGEFVSSGDSTNILNGVAKYRRGSGDAWSPLGQGLLADVFGNIQPGSGRVLCHYGGRLYVGGLFDWAVNASGERIPARFFASWDGDQWRAVEGITFLGPVEAMATDGRNLYVSGPLMVGSSVQAGGVAHWDGVDWRALGNPRYASDLAIYGRHLYLGSLGEVQNNFGVERILSPLWRWDGLGWSRVGLANSWKRLIDGAAVPVQVRNLLVRDDELFVVGDFTEAAGIQTPGMVRIILDPATLADWKSVHFSPAQQIDPLASADDADPDRDGMTNLEEFQAGTDPLDPASRFELDPVSLVRGLNDDGSVTLSFVAEAHKTYTVQFRDGTDPWRRLVDTPARAVSHVERITDRAPTSIFRFYRLVTPALPR